MAEQENEPGIRRADIYNINFYEKLPFYGSYKGMHYRIAKIEDGAETPGGLFDEEAGKAPGQNGGRQLCVTTWPGPYNYETTEESLKVNALFAYSNKGLNDVADYLNQYYREHFSV